MGLEVGFVVLTMAALASKVLEVGWGLSWSMFFVGIIGSAWGAAIYQLLCCEAEDGEKAHSESDWRT